MCECVGPRLDWVIAAGGEQGPPWCSDMGCVCVCVCACVPEREEGRPAFTSLFYHPSSVPSPSLPATLSSLSISLYRLPLAELPCLPPSQTCQHATLPAAPAGRSEWCWGFSNLMTHVDTRYTHVTHTQTERERH